jgi:methionine synthase I (cobalamin-dependent)
MPNNEYKKIFDNFIENLEALISGGASSTSIETIDRILEKLTAAIVGEKEGDATIAVATTLLALFYKSRERLNKIFEEKEQHE